MPRFLACCYHDELSGQLPPWEGLLPTFHVAIENRNGDRGSGSIGLYFGVGRVTSSSFLSHRRKQVRLIRNLKEDISMVCWMHEVSLCKAGWCFLFREDDVRSKRSHLCVKRRSAKKRWETAVMLEHLWQELIFNFIPVFPQCSCG